MKHPNNESSPADVYAGDTSRIGSRGDSDAVFSIFTIKADADPDAFARIAGLLTIANSAPLNASVLLLPREGVLEIRISLDRIPASTAELIRRKLEQLTCVRQVTLHSRCGL